MYVDGITLSRLRSLFLKLFVMVEVSSDPCLSIQRNVEVRASLLLCLVREKLILDIVPVI